MGGGEERGESSQGSVNQFNLCKMARRGKVEQVDSVLTMDDLCPRCGGGNGDQEVNAATLLDEISSHRIAALSPPPSGDTQLGSPPFHHLLHHLHPLERYRTWCKLTTAQPKLIPRS